MDIKQFILLKNRIKKLKVKDVRFLMSIMRKQNITTTSFFPKYGFTSEQFCICYVLNMKD